MNEYAYEQLAVGQEERFERTVTAEMMDCFLTVSGDTNPLHCDEEYARALHYPGRVVYGMLTASLYSALAGVYLPGKHALLHSVDSAFRAPVFIGDRLTVTGRVTEKNDTFRRVTVKAFVENQDGVKVSKATLQIGMP